MEHKVVSAHSGSLAKVGTGKEIKGTKIFSLEAPIDEQREHGKSQIQNLSLILPSLTHL